MEGSSAQRPVSSRVAASLRRIRQERGLSYAELSRRLSAAGYPIADTGLLKAEKGERRITADDLMALAVALGVSPNALLLPAEDDGTPCALTPGTAADCGQAWAWAAGETPLGTKPSGADAPPEARRAEVVFSRENRPHHWNVPAPARPQARDAAAARALAVTGMTAFIVEAFRAGLSTSDIRTVAEGAIIAALTLPDPAAAPVRIEASEGRLTIWAGGPGSAEAQEAQ